MRLPLKDKGGPRDGQVPTFMVQIGTEILTMRYLFDSHGRHIANEVDGRLHAPTGQNIGRFLPQHGLAIDMEGRYLGEIVAGNRLMSRVGSPKLGVNYGRHGNYGNIGNRGNPGNPGSVGTVSGFEDIKTPWL